MNFKKLKALSDLLGNEILKFLSITVVTGALLFAAEYLFIYALQGFLVSIGISDSEAMNLPSWLPVDKNFFFYLLIFVGIFRSALMQFKIYVSRIANQIFLRKFRKSILSHAIANAPYISSHETLGLFSDTLSRAGSVIVEGTSIAITLITTLFLLIVGFIHAPILMAIGLISLLFLAIPIRSLGRTSQKYGHQLSYSWEKTTKILLEGIKHHFFFKVHGLISDKVDQGLEQIHEYEDQYRDYFLVTSIKNTLPQSLGIILIVALSYIGINYLQIQPSNLLAFLYIFLRISQSASEIFTLSNSISLNIPSIQQLKNWVKKAENYPQVAPSLPLEMNEYNIENIKIDNVYYSYSESPLLENINISLKTGDTLLIDGASGRGKSTLIGLLMNILKPNGGEIFLNNESYNFAPHYFRNGIAYVGPEPFLFEGTVRENLLYGNPFKSKISDLEIWSALEDVNATIFVKELSNGLDEKLFEYTQLSTGQKQRLSLARAILRKCSLIVLDEATANLDHQTELDIKHKLEVLIKDKICIIIAHKGELKKLATQKIEL